MPKDIYFEKKYGQLCERIDGGRAYEYEYEDENGKIRNIFIKREIDQAIDGKKYFDITTPYGYGGPIIEELKGDKKTLVENYYEDFKNYCKDNDIVSEFVRFHPLIANVKDFKDIYETVYLRKTVATNLKDSDDPVQEEFHKSTRKNIRRTLRQGVDYEIIENPVNLDVFKSIYFDTMDRNDAEDFYYFDDEYFDYILENLKDRVINVNVYYEGKCIASGLYFVYGPYIHTHLSGTLSEYLNLSPAYILRYALTVWGKEHGKDYIHHGGGTSNDPEDSLFKFKTRFTKDSFFDFHIGKNIYNQEIYNKLVAATGGEDNDFFPQYRRR